MSDDFLGVEEIINEVEETTEPVVEELEKEETQPEPQEKPESKPEPQEDQPKLFKVKINGEEKEVDEAELVKGYQLEQASRQKLEQAAKQMKALENAIKVGKDSPLELLSWLGINTDEFIKNYVMEKVEEAKLTPEQRELKQLKKERDKYLQEQEAIKKKQQEEEEQSTYIQAATKLEDEILGALGNNSKNTQLVSQVANLMLVALNQGKTMSAKEAYARIQNDTQAMLQQALASDDVDTFINSLGKDAQAKLRKALGQMELKQSKPIQASQDKQSKGKKSTKSNNFNDLFGGAHLL